MEEYPSICRKLDWFKPPIAPTNELNLPITIQTFEPNKIWLIKNNGTSFCQVKIIKQENQSRPPITKGTQWWIGQTPNFITTPIVQISSLTLDENKKSQVREPQSVILIPKSKKIDPQAWIMKYLTKYSRETKNLLTLSRGIRQMWASSIPIQMNNQYEEEIENNAPKTRMKKNSNPLDGKSLYIHSFNYNWYKGMICSANLRTLSVKYTRFIEEKV